MTKARRTFLRARISAIKQILLYKIVSLSFKYMFFASPGVKKSSAIYGFITQRLTAPECSEVIRNLYQSGSSVVRTHRVFTRLLDRNHRFRR